MVARTVEFLKEEQIGNICLFADSDGELPSEVALADGVGVRLQVQTLFGMSLSHCDLVQQESVAALSKPLIHSLQRWDFTSSLDSKLIQMA